MSGVVADDATAKELEVKELEAEELALEELEAEEPILTRVFECSIPSFLLECGVPLPSGEMRLWCTGPASRVDALEAHVQTGATHVGSCHVDTLLVHALTGDMQAGGHTGWWEPLIGVGKVFNPKEELIICFNNLGSCYGSTGPNNDDYPTFKDIPNAPQTYPDRPVPLSTWDQAQAMCLALEALRVETITRVVGGSIGGMIAQCFTILAAERVTQLISIAALERSDPWSVGFNHIARKTLIDAQAWRGGPREKQALARARELAMLTYRSESGLLERQSKPPGSPWPSWDSSPIQSYLDYQGGKLVRRFTGASYIVQLDAMDSHDIYRDPDHTGRNNWAIDRLKLVKVDAVGIDTDRLFQAKQISDWVTDLQAHGVSARYHELRSLHGHDAFLIEWAQLSDILNSAYTVGSLNSSVP